MSLLNLKKYFLSILFLIYLNDYCSACNPVVDLSLVVDFSNSIGRFYYDRMMKILFEITDRLNLKHTNSLSVVRFSNSTTKIAEKINSQQTQDIFKDKLKNFLYESKETNLGQAIVFARPQVAAALVKIAVIFTDGLAETTGRFNFIKESENLKALNVEIFAVTLSNQIHYDNLKAIASDPVDKHLLELDDYMNLYDIINERTVQMCDKNAFKFKID